MIMVYDPSPLLQGIYDPRDPRVDKHLRILRAKEEGQRQRLAFLEKLIAEGDGRGFDIFFNTFPPEDRQELVLRMSQGAFQRADRLLKAAGL